MYGCGVFLPLLTAGIQILVIRSMYCRSLHLWTFISFLPDHHGRSYTGYYEANSRCLQVQHHQDSHQTHLQLCAGSHCIPVDMRILMMLHQQTLTHHLEANKGERIHPVQQLGTNDQTEDKSEVFIFCLMLGPERSSIQQMCCDLPFPHSLHFNWHASSNPHIYSQEIGRKSSPIPFAWHIC
ncbi:hypothetical protein GQ55_1G439400 [Panicum hallii var. hallii]|uniref:Uncharacterized protein n=1 Tax=Panicum hallii var. hallii TaxID=1504633 RepID=A0A2T7FDV7_9POAL|nr:hypothetical protein GQ55_1G439400 [Panicum hallii var. hallii]